MRVSRPELNVCLLAPGGGHYKQLCNLESFYRHHRHFIVSTTSNSVGAGMSGDVRTYVLDDVGLGLYRRRPLRFLHRFVAGLVRLARIFAAEKPDVLITTGGGVAVPGFLVAKVFRVKTVFIEAYARVETASLAGRICYRLADLFIVQHARLLERFPRAVHGGSLYRNLPNEDG